LKIKLHNVQHKFDNHLRNPEEMELGKRKDDRYRENQIKTGLGNSERGEVLKAR
jgi:hypothetical protein